MSEGKNGILSLRAAERWLGMPQTHRGRGLLRTLRARERELGKRIVLHLGGKGNGRRYGVTRAALRRHCRDLLPSKVDELRARFSEFLSGIDERIETRVTEHVTEHVEPEISELWERDEIQATAIQELARRVAQIASK